MSIVAKEKTLVGILQRLAIEQPDHRFVTWLDAQCNENIVLTYSQLWGAVGAVAELLVQKGVLPGDRVMISYPPGPQFLAGLFGSMLVGAIPCSVYPPNALAQERAKAKHSFEQFNIQVDDAGAKFALTTRAYKLLLMAVSLQGYKTKVSWLATDKLKSVPIPGMAVSERSLNKIAIIQYSSGSTSAPKGVILSHTNLDANLRAIKECSVPKPSEACAYQSDGDDDHVAVSWLPQYHDYGLIGCYFSFAYTPQMKLISFSPADFIKNPILWADTLEKYKATLTGGPNFAYGLLAKRMQKSGRVLKNSRLVRASMGGESVSWSTIEQMKDIGIPARSINPHYGMAECCLYVASTQGKELTEVDGVVSAGSISRSKAVDFLFLIVDPDTRDLLPDGSEGEIMIWSTSLAIGYWAKPELSKQAFAAMTIEGKDYFATGDIGKIVSDQLYICGRLKELIIINGKNFFPTDIERSVENEFNAIVRPGCTISYQISPTEVGIVLEIRDSAIADGTSSEMSPKAIRLLIQNAHGVSICCVYMLKQGAVPKTTSGKLRRVEAKRLSLAEDWPKKATVLAWKQGANASHNRRQMKTINRDIETGDRFDEAVSHILGETYDSDLTWNELGLSSMASIELRDVFIDILLVDLPPNFQEDYPTPKELRVFVETNTHTPFPVKLPTFLGNEGGQSCKDVCLSMVTSTLLQGFGVIMLLLILAFSFVPAYQFGQLLTCRPEISEPTSGAHCFALDSTSVLYWQLQVLTIPIWMLSLTFTLIIAKWVCIGRYKEIEIPVLSFQYIRWWFIDRLTEVWELFVGKVIKDTPLLWLVYFSLGAKIHPSTKLDAFIREFDLVEIGAHSEVKLDLVCRRFSLWESDDGLRLRFRRIQVGRQCVIRGLVGIGACIGDLSYIERLAAVPEGAQVPSKSYAKGSPALCHGEYAQREELDNVSSTSNLVLFAVMKLLALLVELQFFSACTYVGQRILEGRLPARFRYTLWLYWIIILLFTSFLSMLTCVILKWVLIGKKRPGHVPSHLWAVFADWFVDYHFGLSLTLFDIFFENTKLVNIYLIALGMDVDFASHIWAVHFPPSKLDLISVRRTFFSTVILDVEHEGEYKKIEVMNSSVGYSVVVKAGAKIKDSQVPPLSIVKGTLNGLKSEIAKTPINYSTGLWCCLFGIVVIASLIVAFEVSEYNAGDPAGLGFSVTKFALVLVAQMTTWLSLYALLQRIILKKSCKDGWQSRSQGMYEAYMTITYFLVWRYSLLILTFGTPFMNLYLRCLGAKVEGRMYYFAMCSYDHPLLTFRNRTVVDRSVVSGHAVDMRGLHFGPSIAAGVLHAGVNIMANTDATGAKELGPSRFILPTAMITVDL